ncbi:fibronectin type III domain-containing protein, partial [[Eubacterium] cellulosolvens]
FQVNWKPNTENDLKGYKIYMNGTDTGSTGEFHEINTTIGLETRYTLPKLAEQTTYYFKIRAYDEVPNLSPFSNVTTATTKDLTEPGAPTGVKVTNPTYESLTIKWNASPEEDVVGYFIYCGMTLAEEFVPLNIEPLLDNHYLDAGLEEDTTYYYKISAIDDADYESQFSEIVSGKTIFAPRAPEINNTVTNFKIKEDTSDDSINLFYWFKDVNNDPLEFRCDGQDYIDVTIYQANGTVLLEPEQDWNGKETLTFYAKDKDGETFDEIAITVMPVNDPPEIPTITSLDDNIIIKSGEKLDFEARCDDPDLPYGDELTFNWFSSITGKVGVGDTLTGVVLKPGKHLITLEVSDNAGAKSNTTINITVKKKDERGGDGGSIAGLVAGLVVIIIIIIVVFILFLRKRKMTGEAKEEVPPDARAEVTQPGQIQPSAQPPQFIPPVVPPQQPSMPVGMPITPYPPPISMYGYQQPFPPQPFIYQPSQIPGQPITEQPQQTYQQQDED